MKLKMNFHFKSNTYLTLAFQNIRLLSQQIKLINLAGLAN